MHKYRLVGSPVVFGTLQWVSMATPLCVCKWLGSSLDVASCLDLLSPYGHSSGLWLLYSWLMGLWLHPSAHIYPINTNLHNSKILPIIVKVSNGSQWEDGSIHNFTTSYFQHKYYIFELVHNGNLDGVVDCCVYSLSLKIFGFEKRDHLTHYSK